MKKRREKHQKFPKKRVSSKKNENSKEENSI
jgi:hypothetical protein